MGIRLLVLCVISSFLVSGCAVNFYKQNPRSKQKIQELEQKVDELERLRMEEQAKFDAANRMMEEKLKDQIAGKQISLRRQNGGLVVVLSNSILFDSGKAVLKSSSKPILDKVIDIILSELPEKNVGIEGHTDNVPITVSGWKSNWELSTARATEVLHYVESKGVAPEKLSATGYGEYRPVASNDTAEGRSANRRVEIIILPEYEVKKYEEASSNNFAK